MIFQHGRYQIWNIGQHPYRHAPEDIAYTTAASGGLITNIGQAMDWIFAVIYPNLEASVANPAALPLVGNTINDYRVVQDDGDGKQAGYRWEQREGDGSAQWYKIYDFDWSSDAILAAFLDITQDEYVHKQGRDDADETGTALVGDLAGQHVYGGVTAGTHLTLHANAGDGVGAQTGFVQTEDPFRPFPGTTLDLGTTTERWNRVWCTSAQVDTMLISTGSIVDSTGAIDFDDETLTTSTSVTAGTLTISSGSIIDTSGLIDFDDEDLTTTGDITANDVTGTTGTLGWWNFATDTITMDDGVAADIDAIIVPKGTGSFLLSSSGNARGDNAVDFQVIRGPATQVASGDDSILAGRSNTASGADSISFGGVGNTSSGTRSALFGGSSNSSLGQDSVVLGGSGNNITAGINTTILGGSSNAVSANYATAFGGTNNTASHIRSIACGSGAQTAGNYDFVVGGVAAASSVDNNHFRVDVNGKLYLGHTSGVATSAGLFLQSQTTIGQQASFIQAADFTIDSVGQMYLSPTGFLITDTTVVAPAADGGASLGLPSVRYSNLYLSTSIQDGTDAITMPTLMSFRDANVGVADGMTLFWNNAAQKWLPSLPDTEIDHGDISNLNLDHHMQYALLAGRASGQTLVGGVNAGSSLVLESTSNASKGNIFFQSSALPFTDTAVHLGALSRRWDNLYMVGEGIGFRMENAANFAGLPAASASNPGRLAWDLAGTSMYVDTGGTWLQVSTDQFYFEDAVGWTGASTSVAYNVSATVTNAKRMVWQFKDNSDDYAIVAGAYITHTSDTNVTVTFDVAPAAGTYTLVGR